MHSSCNTSGGALTLILYCAGSSGSSLASEYLSKETPYHIEPPSANEQETFQQLHSELRRCCKLTARRSFWIPEARWCAPLVWCSVFLEGSLKHLQLQSEPYPQHGNAFVETPSEGNVVPDQSTICFLVCSAWSSHLCQFPKLHLLSQNWSVSGSYKCIHNVPIPSCIFCLSSDSMMLCSIACENLGTRWKKMKWR